jgi:hypothetical protein
MSADTQVAELEHEVHFLMEEVERYRSAAEDALQQLDWCIGYFAGSHKGALARSLSANRSHIRTKYLRRDEQSTPSSKPSESSSKSSSKSPSRSS